MPLSPSTLPIEALIPPATAVRKPLTEYVCAHASSAGLRTHSCANNLSLAE